MLSAIRRALGQSTRFAPFRRLSTLTSDPLVANPVDRQIAQDVPPPSQILSQVLAVNAAGPSKISPFTPPIYLTMSSLISPTESAPSDNVVELEPFVFGAPIRRDILHLCVVHHLDSVRQGSANTKTRGEVRGSGRKIRPQKHTGRARLGDGQSPMLHGGGVAFGPKPRNFATKLNRKVIQMGMRVALSARVKENCLGVVESLEWGGEKTKELAARIDELGWRKTLLVSGHQKVPEGLKRATGNIYKVDATTAGEVKVYDLVKWPRVILDLAAVEWFEQKLGKPSVAPRIYTP